MAPRSATATRRAAISTLEALNASLERRFRRHGRYVSRHQISVLLLCSLVITSLFYPAVGIYFWSSKGGPGVTRGSAASVWRSLSTPFIDSFISSGRKHHNSIRDLRMIWDDANDLRALDAKDARALFGSSPQAPDTSIHHPLFPYGGLPNHQHHHADSKDAQHKPSDPSSPSSPKPRRPSCRSVRVEHVFVTTDDVLTGQAHRFGVLEPRILSSALRLQSAIERILRERDASKRQAMASTAFRIPECARVHRIEDLFADMEPLPKGCPEEQEVQRVQVRDAPCLTLSPNDYWSGDMQALLADATPTRTVLQSSRNTTERTIPLRISTTLAGRWHLFRKLPRAEHLAMTFFLEDEHAGEECAQLEERTASSQCLASGGRINSSHRAWMQMLANVTAGQVTIIPSEHEEAKELLLQFTPENPRAGIPASKLLLLAGYFGLAAYLARGLSKIRNVHSRFGMMFTCITELCISLITSVSICALLGVRLTLLPWEILPFVIAVVGSEHMFNLTAAIVDTPVDLPVASRVAIGLSQAGIPILITVLSDVLLLGTMAGSIGVRAVHEFCIFAICSLVIDFFMQMTFFVTVLSIDLQRLELADVLAQGGSVPAPPALVSQQNGVHPASSTALAKRDGAVTQRFARRSSTSLRRSSSLIQKGGRALWRARTARTASLSLLMGLMFGIYLYYGTGYPQAPDFPYPAQGSAPLMPSPMADGVDGAVASHGFDPLAHLSPSPEEAQAIIQRLRMPWWMSSPSGPFWHALNPRGAPKVHVFVEPWTILSLRSAHPHFHGPTSKSFAVWALFRPRIRAIIWFLKVVILPITGTTTLLFFLLLYLLKDTDLLDAQRGKDEAETDTDRSDDEMDARDLAPSLELTYTVASSRHASDIVLTAASQAWVASIDADGKLSYWRYSRSKVISPTSVKHSSYAGADGARPTALAITSAGGLVTIGLADGRICLVALSTGKVLRSTSPKDESIPQPNLPVQHITIHDGDGEQANVFIVSQYRDGSAWRWSVDPIVPTCIVPSRSTCRWQAFDVTMCAPALDNAGHTVPRLFGFASSDSQLELRTCSVEQDDSVKTFSCAQTQGRLIRCAALAPLTTMHKGGTALPQEVLSLITGSSDGIVDVWDHNSATHLGTIELGQGPIVSLRVIEERERGTTLVCASMSSSIAVLRLSYGPLTDGTITASVSQSSAGGLPPTPTTSGVHRTPAGIKYASPSSIVVPSSAALSLSPSGHSLNLPPPPFETYRLSGHNGSVKYRRSSSYGGHGRNGSYFGSEVGSTSLSSSALGVHDAIDPLSSSPGEPPLALPVLSPSTATAAAAASQPIVIQDLGRIINERGVVEVVKQSVFIGVRRRYGLSSQSYGGGSRTRSMDSTSSASASTSNARWEAWSLDTSRGAIETHDGIIDVVACELDLDTYGEGPIKLGGVLSRLAPSDGPKASSSAGTGTGSGTGTARDPPSTTSSRRRELPPAFFQRGSTRDHLPPQLAAAFEPARSSSAWNMLSFTRLHSVHELVTSTPVVALAFGNVSATLAVRICEPLALSSLGSAAGSKRVSARRKRR